MVALRDMMAEELATAGFDTLTLNYRRTYPQAVIDATGKADDPETGVTKVIDLSKYKK